MRYGPAILALLLAGCQADDQMYEVTCESAAVAQKDGVLLASYRLSPARIDVDDRFHFILKEAFMQRRLMMNFRTGASKLIDPTTTRTKLVIVGTEDSSTGVLGADIEAELLDSTVIKKYGYGLKASHIEASGFAFDLQPVHTFRCQELRIKLEVFDNQHHPKTFFLTATPVRCYPAPDGKSNSSE